MIELLFVVSSSASGGASVGRMPAQLDVDPFPLFIGHCGFIASSPLNFIIKQEQIH